MTANADDHQTQNYSLTLGSAFFIALSTQPARFFITIAFAQSRSIPAPADVLGFTPGDDRKLASWAKVVEYFQKLAAASDRVKFEEIGKTTMGAPFVYATISAPKNLAHLNEYKEIQRQLADPRILGSPRNPAAADRKAAQLIARGKTVIAITCGIHSTEVGSYLSSMLIAYRLASSNEPEIQEILRNTIILLVPSTNPDGVDIVNNWYQKTLGTPYEGTDPPELYHKYTGHDDNRDWYAFTQVETQLVVDKILNVWHPQIVHDIHQQGAFGSRLFLPPYMQPVEPNVPKQIVEGYTELGNYLAKEMRATGYQGNHHRFDLRRLVAFAGLLALSRRRADFAGDGVVPAGHADHSEVRATASRRRLRPAQRSGELRARLAGRRVAHSRHHQHDDDRRFPSAEARGAKS